MIRGNYHTHTTRCKHAVGRDEEYVKRAIEAGYDVLAFTDHSPWNLLPFESGMIRMDVDELEGYVQSVRSLKKKYHGQIQILLGLEAEYFETRIDWLKEIKEKYEMDLIVFGNHFHEYDKMGLYYGFYSDRKNVVKDYVNDAVAGMRTGLYTIFAHPDLFVSSLVDWNDNTVEEVNRLCDVANECNVILEYNLGGLRNGGKYPYLPFWEIVASKGCRVIIGVDAHNPNDLLDDQLYKKAETTLLELGCNLIYSV